MELSLGANEGLLPRIANKNISCGSALQGAGDFL
jgi:hypothetical protein